MLHCSVKDKMCSAAKNFAKATPGNTQPHSLRKGVRSLRCRYLAVQPRLQVREALF